MKITITLDYPPNATKRFGANAYYAGKHWAVRKADAEYWHTLLSYEAPWNRPPLDKPVRITYYWNDRLDLSNHSIMGKFIEDGIKGRIIKDDSRKYVQEIVHKWHDENCIKIVIEEIDNDV